jgi:hypothetical protein
VIEVDHEAGTATLELAGRRGDDVLMPGSAVVALPRRDGGS